MGNTILSFDEFVNEAWTYTDEIKRKSDGEEVFIKFYKEPGISGVVSMFKKYLKTGKVAMPKGMSFSNGSKITDDEFKVTVKDKDFAIEKVNDTTYAIDRRG